GGESAQSRPNRLSGHKEHHMTRFGTIASGLTLPALLLVATIEVATAAALQVANNGDDGSTSCSSAAPCRSISHAIALASAGDKIVVGPGMYGDLNHNNTQDAGDEPLTGIVVNKQLTITSRDGASSTLILMRGDSTAVTISADNAVFGKKGK